MAGAEVQLLGDGSTVAISVRPAPPQVLELSLRELKEGETRLGTITVAYDAVGEEG